MFIERSIGGVQEHVMIGSLLVILIIFAFLRDFRSTLIICTSIPISVIGTFALLYFGGYTLNTMTFGGLALGVGMIVDAAIVVLENTFRHLEMGKDRMTAAIDGSEEVWSAILASTLTHIAVFVPLLFLTASRASCSGSWPRSSSFSLAMSLFVAVTIVPVLCSRLLRLPPPADERRGLAAGVCSGCQRTRCSTAWTTATARCCTCRCTTGRPCFARRPGAVRRRHRAAAARRLRAPPTTDEGEVTVDAELAVGTRIEVHRGGAASGSKRRSARVTPEAVDAHHPGRRRWRRRRSAAARPTAATSPCA